MQIPDECVTFSAKLPSKQAWAKYARTRWQENAVGHAQAEWDLSPSRARGLVYGNVTQQTVDQIRKHPRGGIGIALTVEAVAFDITLDELLARFITRQIQEAADERQKQEDRVSRLDSLRRQLPGLGRVGLGLVPRQDRRGDSDRRSGAGRDQYGAADGDLSGGEA